MKLFSLPCLFIFTWIHFYSLCYAKFYLTLLFSFVLHSLIHKSLYHIILLINVNSTPPSWSAFNVEKNKLNRLILMPGSSSLFAVFVAVLYQNKKIINRRKKNTLNYLCKKFGIKAYCSNMIKTLIKDMGDDPRYNL